MINDYVSLLVDELFKHIDASTLDLSDPIALEKMGKIFSRIKTYRSKKIMFNIVSSLNREQFNIIFPYMKTTSPTILGNLLFTCNYIETDEDFIALIKGLNKSISKQQIMSTKSWALGRFTNMKVKSKIPRKVLFKLKPLARLKILRALAFTKEYPLAEHINKTELEASLFPLIFEYKQAVQGFIDNWKW